MKKNLELQQFLQKQQIDVLCIQETHPNEDCRFSMWCFQCLRQDIPSPKGEVIIMVRNNIPSTQVSMNLKDSEHRTIKQYTKSDPIFTPHFYCPNTERLNLSEIKVSEFYHKIVGDAQLRICDHGLTVRVGRRRMTENRLVIINEPQAEPIFYSRQGKS